MVKKSDRRLYSFKLFFLLKHLGLLLVNFFYLDIDECTSDPCDGNANCTNTKRSFVCECNVGFSGDGFDCTGKK